ncbi:MAG: CHASE domain-containing protein, partial [Desulfarculus sp.]|nr:CHASE domain-containing protein [Desulfarculus sp.]
MTSQTPPPPKSPSPPRLRGLGLAPWLTLAVGAAVSLAVAWYVLALEQSQQTAEFQRRARTLCAAVERELNVSLSGLEDFAQFMALTPGLERQGFGAYGQSIMARHAGLNLLAYLPKVAAGQRAALEARAAAEGLTGFQVRQLDAQSQLEPAGRRPEYFPVLFLLGGERIKAGEVLLGLDMAAVPQVAAAMSTAAQSGHPAATGRQRLPHLPVERPHCIMVLLPLYQAGAGQRPPEDRTLRGYLLGLLTLSDLVDLSLLHAASAQANLLLEDCAATGEDRLSYRQREAGPQPEVRDLPPELVHTHVFTAAGRQRSVTATPSRAFLQEASHWPGLALGGGLLAVSLLAALLLHLAQGRARRAQALAQERARQLEQALGQTGQIFHMVPTPIFTVDLEQRITSVNRRFEEVTGYQAREVLGQPCRLFALGPCEHHCGLMDTGQDKPIENRRCAIRAKDGGVLQAIRN